MSISKRILYTFGYSAVAVPLFTFYLAYSFISYSLMGILGKEGLKAEDLRTNAPLILGLITVMAFVTNVSASLARVEYDSKIHEAFKRASPLFFVSTIALIGLVALLAGLTLEIKDGIYSFLLSTYPRRILSGACAVISAITCVMAVFILIFILGPVAGKSMFSASKKD